MDIAEKLKKLRAPTGLSQRELAKELNITKSAYSNYESGIRMPSYEILIKICKYFEVTSDYLLGLDENSI